MLCIYFLCCYLIIWDDRTTHLRCCVQNSNIRGHQSSHVKGLHILERPRPPRRYTTYYLWRAQERVVFVKLLGCSAVMCVEKYAAIISCVSRYMDVPQFLTNLLHTTIYTSCSGSRVISTSICQLPSRLREYWEAFHLLSRQKKRRPRGEVYFCCSLTSHFTCVCRNKFE